MDITRKTRRFLFGGASVTLLVAAIGFVLATRQSLMTLPTRLPPAASSSALVFTARDGTPLNRTYQTRFNYRRTLPLWRMPPLLKKAFIAAEDKRYWQHGGADWRARFAALWQNFRAGKNVRGASTIGEQAVRILKPRARSYWSHWIAGLDAGRLLDRFGRAEVLEFYLNQVPYGGQRRGVVPAAHYYFDDDPGSLSAAELLALAVLVRSPVYYNPRNHPEHLRGAVNRLAALMHERAIIDEATYSAIMHSTITTGKQVLPIQAAHFVVHAKKRARALGLRSGTLRTTLDPQLERFVQRTLQARLKRVTSRGARNAAALVVDNASGEILAWATAPADDPFGIDPVLEPRQPGSALKPFVYALAMENLGWQAYTVINDAPLAETVEPGVHSYRNYSGHFYGPVSLRYALANSLNIPAVKTAQAVGVTNILTLLRKLGFTTFDQTANYYGPAIALGDGPVRLFDMVQAYATLARHGQFLPLRVLEQAPQPPSRLVLDPTVTSLIADILSDPTARAAEFGRASVLDLPWPTAVKTGTSSDYRDAWVVGFDNRYTVGIWMGRLDGGRMQGVTGSLGPALAMRQVFDYLRRGGNYAGLWHSPRLIRIHACERLGDAPCTTRPEWRLPGQSKPNPASTALAIARPLPGETIALDPRLPGSSQSYLFKLVDTKQKVKRVEWILDSHVLDRDKSLSTSWILKPGKHQLQARVWLADPDKSIILGPVHFRVLGREAS